MPSKKPPRRLDDIIDNIDLMKAYTRGASYDSFVQDGKLKMRSNVVWRGYQKLPVNSKARRKRGSAVVTNSGDRNIIRHEYDTIDAVIIWNIIDRNLDSLKSSIEAALEKLRRQSPNVN